MSDELSRHRLEVLNLLAQRKEDIERVSETGVPLLHRDTEIVRMCLHYILAELAMKPPPMESLGGYEEGIPATMQWDHGDYKPTQIEPQPGPPDDSSEVDYGYGYEPQGMTAQMNYDDGRNDETTT